MLLSGRSAEEATKETKRDSGNHRRVRAKRDRTRDTSSLLGSSPPHLLPAARLGLFSLPLRRAYLSASLCLSLSHRLSLSVSGCLCPRCVPLHRPQLLYPLIAWYFVSPGASRAVAVSLRAVPFCLPRPPLAVHMSLSLSLSLDAVPSPAASLEEVCIHVSYLV